ncbi:hypothetical protein I3271_00040 [Photobacterium leiognathi]|uniref:capsular polysaccharide export protein, LipB/KpsS family n=1 Tax=Photobacterium leiognathi TaxID=553611 RepID=UPI001EDDAF0A|nr:hypothetical protein [Photobacterium leiognathi]MCG3883080.1 hypothetical protein [Photobacterium leiognathi]
MIYLNRAFKRINGLALHMPYPPCSVTVKYLLSAQHLGSPRPKLHLIWGNSRIAKIEQVICRALNIPVLYCNEMPVGLTCKPSEHRIDAVVTDPHHSHMDCRSYSLLEGLIHFTKTDNDDNESGRYLMSQIYNYDLAMSGTTYIPPHLIDVIGKEPVKVLVIDQSRKDETLVIGNATRKSFPEMIKTALNLNPNGMVFVKASKNKESILCDLINHKRIKIYNSIQLFKLFEHVVVSTSFHCFEALICKCTVHCFGVPFYAHWGLTTGYCISESAMSRRLKGYCQYQTYPITKKLEHICHCLLDKYTKYSCNNGSKLVFAAEYFDFLISQKTKGRPHVGDHCNIDYLILRA